MARGELENRDAEEIHGLGDLPDPLALERGELRRRRDEFSDIPADMIGSDAARNAAALTGLGTPELDFTVRSSYDSRPVNAVDFIQPAILRFQFDSCSSIIFDDSNSSIFQVPFGRVAVLRKIAFKSMSTDVTGGSMVSANAPADFMVQVTKNSGVVLPMNMTPEGFVVALGGSFQQRAIPINCPDEITLFQVYDELETFGLNFLVYSTAAFNDGTFYVPVTFYGNLLVKTGAPAPFEIANSGPGKKAMSTASAADIFGARPMGAPPDAARQIAAASAAPRAVAPSPSTQRQVTNRAQHFRDVEAGRKKDTFRRVRK